MCIYSSRTVDLPCGSEVSAQVEPGGEIRVIIDGEETYTGLNADVVTEIAEALTDAARASREERENVRFAGRRVVLTGKFHGTRQDLERRIRQAGGIIQDFVYTGALVVTGDLPYRHGSYGTFKSKKAAQVNAQTVTARQAHEALVRRGY